MIPGIAVMIAAYATARLLLLPSTMTKGLTMTLIAWLVCIVCLITIWTSCAAIQGAGTNIGSG